MPIATVGTPFSMRETVRGEQVARSATWAILRFLRSLASLLTYYQHLLLQFSWQLGTHRTFRHSSTYHIICKYSSFALFYDVLQR